MKKSLTILMALALAAALAACNQPLAPSAELAVEAGNIPDPGKERVDKPILPPDPEIQPPPHIDPEPDPGNGGGGGSGGGGEPRPRVDL